MPIGPLELLIILGVLGAVLIVLVRHRPAQATKVCPNCGANVWASAAFCPRCGFHAT